MSVHIEELIAALRGRGHQVLVIGPTTRETAASPRFETVLETVRRRLPRAAVEFLELVYNGPAFFRLLHAGRRFRPDIIYERYNLFLIAGLWFKRVYKIPLLLEINSPLARERASFGGLALKRLAGLCERMVWRGADAVLPVSAVLAAEVRGRRQADAPLHVISNAVDIERFAPPADRTTIRRELGLELMLVLGFAGFVRSWHGLDWAVDVLAELPENVHLLVLGDGPACEDLRARARALGVARRCHLLGRLRHDVMARYMGAFDIALQPRAVDYASPLKLFEYMALALPIVAPDQPNIREILVSEKTGLLFAPEDGPSFVGAIRRLCGDATLRKRLGDAARQEVITVPLSWSNNAARIEAIAEALISGARSGQLPVGGAACCR